MTKHRSTMNVFVRILLAVSLAATTPTLALADQADGAAQTEAEESSLLATSEDAADGSAQTDTTSSEAATESDTGATSEDASDEADGAMPAGSSAVVGSLAALAATATEDTSASDESAGSESEADAADAVIAQADALAVIKTLDEYDAQLATLKSNSSKTDAELAQSEEYLTLLWQRRLVEKIGYDELTARVSADADFAAAVYWLFTDYEALSYYIAGGEPEANAGTSSWNRPTSATYLSSLTVLSDIFKLHSADVTGDAVTENAPLYKRIMLAIALTHSVQNLSWYDRVGAAMGGFYWVTESEPVERYEIFKRFYDHGLLSTVFPDLNMDEMRMVVAAQIDNDQLQWANHYYHTAVFGNTDYLTDPVSFTLGVRAYGGMFSYSCAARNPYRSDAVKQYFAAENYDTWNELYDLSVHDGVYDYDVPYGYNEKGQVLMPMWLYKYVGGVCADISGTSVVGYAALGIPCIQSGQPGHLSFMSYGRDGQGRDTWSNGYDVYGLMQSTARTYGQTHLPGDWGDYDWTSYYNMGYLYIGTAAQDNLDNTNYDLAQTLSQMAENLLDAGDAAGAIELYREALDAQYYNLTAWDGLARAYEAAGKTDADYYALAQEAAEKLKFQPQPMYDYICTCLYERVESLTVKADLLALTATQLTWSYNNYASSPFAQNGNIRTYASGFVNSMTKLASFSLTTGVLTLNSEFTATDADIEYSLDGGTTWTTWEREAGDATVTFTDEELASITADNDIRYRFAGAQADPHTINITTGATPTSNAKTNTQNDNENVFLNVQSGLEYSTDGGSTWSDLTASSTFEGDLTVLVRRKASGTVLPSASLTFTFTASTGTPDRSYVSTSAVTLVSGPLNYGSYVASLAFDGKENTQWLSPYGSAKDSLTKNSETGEWETRHTWEFVVELDEVRFLSAMTYLPGDNVTGYQSYSTAIQGCEVYVSMDGETWTLAASTSGWAADTTLKSLEFDEPAYAKYVKIKTTKVGTYQSSLTRGYYYGVASVKEFAFYENYAVDSLDITGMSIVTDGAKTSYKVGDKLDADNFAAQITYSDGTTSLVPGGALGFDADILDTVGTTTVTASYGGASASFDVEVAENDRTATEIAGVTTADLTYYAGDAFDPDNATVCVTDGSESWYLLPGEYAVEGTLAEGENTLTVAYGSLTGTFTVQASAGIASLAVNSDDIQKQYSLGDSFDAAGLTVTATMLDGSTVELDESAYELWIADDGATTAAADDDADADNLASMDTFSQTPGSKVLRVSLKDKGSVYVDFDGVTVLPYLTSGPFTFEVNDGETTCVLTSYEPEDGYEGSTVEIPSTLELNGVTYTVTSIGQGAFGAAAGVTAVSLPATVTEIESGAFSGCTGLTSIYMLNYESLDGFACADDAVEAVEGGLVFLPDALQGSASPIPGYTVASVLSQTVSLELEGPSKTAYALGEELDVSDLTVRAVLGNGSSLIAEAYTLSGYDASKVGTQTVTVGLEGSAATASFDVEVAFPDVAISAQPQGRAYATGATIETLAVEAAPAAGDYALSYQWYRADSEDGAGTAIEGATEASYTPEGAGFYYVEVYQRDAAGAESDRVTSDRASVTVGDFAAVIGTTGYSTVAAALAAAADGDVIELTADGTVSATLTATASKAITIDGAGHTLKRASGFAAAFVNVATGGNLTLKNVTLDGGAEWTGVVDATLGRGTTNIGLKASAPLVTVSGTSSFTLGEGAVLQNNAFTNGGGSNVAGGISTVRTSGNNSKATIVIDGGSIRNMSSTSYGSVMHVRDSSTVTIKSGIIQGNYAPNSGNICSDNSAVLTISGGTFSNNKSGGTAGVIWSSNGTTTISGGTFSNNSAATTGGVYHANTANATLTITGGTFENNAAGTNGGVAYVQKSSAISNATFAGNTAGGNGGALCLTAGGSVTGGTFQNNVSTGGSGGAVYAGAALTVTGAAFAGNEASSNGGALYMAKGSSIVESSFDGNAAGSAGGAAYSLASTEVRSATFESNAVGDASASTSGGALYLSAGGTLSTVSFTGNVAGAGGGIWSNGALTVAAVSFDGNEASTGAAIHLDSSKALTITSLRSAQEIYLKDFSSSTPPTIWPTLSFELSLCSNVELEDGVTVAKLGTQNTVARATWNGTTLVAATVDSDRCLVVPTFADDSSAGSGTASYDVSGFRSSGEAASYVAPQREGYAFTGWYTDSTCQTALDTATTSGTAYAHFVKVSNTQVGTDDGILNFQGGSLRADLGTDYSAAYLRQGFNIDVPEGCTWTRKFGWYYGTTEALGHSLTGTSYVDLGDGTYRANIVFTGVPAANYDSSIYTAMWVEYTTPDGTTVRATDTVVRMRSVNDVCSGILADGSGATEAERTLATGLQSYSAS